MVHPITYADVLKEPVLARFRDNVQLSQWGCLEWRTAAVGGYGTVRVGGKTVRAHRVAWVMRWGKDVPEGLVIDHLCCNKACVNADHLEAVTEEENIRRIHRPPKGWTPVPVPILTECNVKGHRWFDVQWLTADFGKVEKHFRMFDDPDEAAAFVEFLSNAKPSAVVGADEAPRDIRDRLLQIYTEAGARSWLYTAHRKLGGKKPIELIQVGKSAEVRAVLDWVSQRGQVIA